ncbi:MAG: hypothetical protein PHH85_03495 [Candidatus Methanoperedens sp.]|nr:hypothetical protein [Candidatus Methanoperedens sp.]
MKLTDLAKVLLVKFWYTLGLFTIIYLGILVYSLVFGLNIDSEYTALVVLGISAGVAATDIVLLMSDKVSPALVAMVLWVSPFYALNKFFKNKDLFNLDSSHLSKILLDANLFPLPIKKQGQNAP